MVSFLDMVELSVNFNFNKFCYNTNLQCKNQEIILDFSIISYYFSVGCKLQPKWLQIPDDLNQECVTFMHRTVQSIKRLRSRK